MNAAAPARFAALVLIVALCLAASSARATTGGDTRLHVLGYDSSRDILMLLRCMEGEVESGQGCALLLLDVQSGRLRESRQFAGDDPEARLARLQRLRGWLTPLAPVGRSAVTLERDVVRRYRRWVDFVEADMRFMTLRVRAMVGGHEAETRVEAFGHSRIQLRDAFRVPGSGATIVIFAYHGDPVEFGYDVDELLLVPGA